MHHENANINNTSSNKMATYNQAHNDGTYSIDINTPSDRSNQQYGTPQSPSSYMPSHEDLDFMPSSGHGRVEGSMTSGQTAATSDESAYGIRKRGFASSMLESKGFSWLLEEEEDTEEDQRPILEELDIDLKDIYYKLRCVLFPLPQLGFNRHVVRESPDFWGPLIVILLYAVISLYGQFRVVSWILTIWLFGSMMIFLLARVLGGEVSYSQCLGVIGYSVLPLFIIALVLPLFRSFHYISLTFKLLGVLWASYSAGSLLCVQELQHKKPLLLYPVFLLYIYFLSLYTGA